MTPAELWRLKEFAQDWLSADDANITNALESGELEEVRHEQR